MTFRESIRKELRKNKDKSDLVLSGIIWKKFPGKALSNIRRRVGEERRELKLFREDNSNEYYEFLEKLIKQYPELSFLDLARKVQLKYGFCLDTISNIFLI